jgi:hypothetical protein
MFAFFILIFTICVSLMTCLFTFFAYFYEFIFVYIISYIPDISSLVGIYLQIFCPSLWLFVLVFSQCLFEKWLFILSPDVFFLVLPSSLPSSSFLPSLLLPSLHPSFCTQVCTQGFALTRQVLYHLRHLQSSFFLSCIVLFVYYIRTLWLTQGCKSLHFILMVYCFNFIYLSRICVHNLHVGQKFGK